MTKRDPLLMGAKLRIDPIVFVQGYRGIAGHEPKEIALNYLTDCFALAVGESEYKYPELAAKLAAETAIWGYKVIRTRPAIWAMKRIFIKRIFRSVNLTLWQKHKEEEFSDLVVATLGVAIIIELTFWIAAAGSVGIYLLRGGNLRQLNFPDVDEQGRVRSAVGLQKPALIPQVTHEKLKKGDTIFLASRGFIGAINDEMLKNTFGDLKRVTETELKERVDEILNFAQSKQREAEMSLTVIHRQLDFI